MAWHALVSGRYHPDRTRHWASYFEPTHRSLAPRRAGHPHPTPARRLGPFYRADTEKLMSIMESPARTGVAGQVRDHLLARLSTPPDLYQVAGSFYMSERTLRRRLAEEGVSFRALLDEIREQLAEELVVANLLSVPQIAERLGYGDISSFSQAFRRWKGVGPREYRRGRGGEHRSERSG